MRITELDSIHTCSDEEMIALRDKFYVELADINGITVEEMKSLEDPNLPEAEKERLIEKMKNALVGDTRGLEAMGADLEKREAAKGGKLTNEEKMAFLAENQGNLSDLGSMMEKMQATNEKTTAFNAKFVKLEQMTVQQTEKMKKILQASDGAITSCEKIAGEYESELKTLYAQIYETDDSQKVEELYARADERMKNYRLRAAKLWRNSLQTQLDGGKGHVSGHREVAERDDAGGNHPGLRRETCLVQRRDQLHQYLAQGVLRLPATAGVAGLHGDDH